MDFCSIVEKFAAGHTAGFFSNETTAAWAQVAASIALPFFVLWINRFRDSRQERKRENISIAMCEYDIEAMNEYFEKLRAANNRKDPNNVCSIVERHRWARRASKDYLKENFELAHTLPPDFVSHMHNIIRITNELNLTPTEPGFELDKRLNRFLKDDISQKINSAQSSLDQLNKIRARRLS